MREQPARTQLNHQAHHHEVDQQQHRPESHQLGRRATGPSPHLMKISAASSSRVV